MKICFNVIYNHKYVTNVAKIEKYYQGKFSDINHLMPFYDKKTDGETNPEEKIITVFESSHNFQGFFAQAFQQYYKKEYEYYIFIADDLILNPSLNESNIIETFNCEPDKGYIKSLELLSKRKKLFRVPKTGIYFYNGKFTPWYKLKESNHAIYIKDAKGKLKSNRFLETERYLMDVEKWKAKLRNLGISREEIENSGEKYPLLLSFSDLIIVPKSGIEKFCYYCGLFAAANLHVELAAPTALAMSIENLVTEKDLKWKGMQHSLNEKKIFTQANLEGAFKKRITYIHPIKLSNVSFKH